MVAVEAVRAADIVGEAAPLPGEGARVAQERAVQQREVAADADEAVADLASPRQRGIVPLDDDAADAVD
jgi:hypothetical protein